MSEAKPATLRAVDVEPRTTTIYPAPFAAELKGREKRALGDAFGLDRFGVNLTTMAPGTWSSQRHWHEQEDEFVYVLSGELTLIDDAGEHLLAPGMCAGFKAGVANGHHLVNKSSAPASYLEIGTRSGNEVCHYSEADMNAAKAGGKWALTRKDGTPF